MPDPAATPLPSSVVSLDLEGKSIFLLGTAHVSRQSVDDVRAAAAALAPDTVAVELCEPRYRSLSDPNAWRDTDLFKLVRQKKTTFLLAQLAMQAFYRRVGKRLETEPGAEMMEAARFATASGARLELVDRRIDLTLKRVWAALGFWQKTKLAGLLLSSIFSSGDEVSAEDVENLKQSDQLESAMGELGRAFPGVKTRLMDERDEYLAEKIRRAPGARILAVVGAGHVPGILRHIRTPRDLAPLDALPPRSRWSRLWPWLVPLAVLAILVLGFFRRDPSVAVHSVLVWTLVNAVSAALGALAALAHPLAVLAAALAAPVTSLNPAIAAGWVAGLVQVWIRPPAVRDFESLPADLESFRTFFRNPVARVLLVVALANLGSALGTWIALPWIAALCAS